MHTELEGPGTRKRVLVLLLSWAGQQFGKATKTKFGSDFMKQIKKINLHFTFKKQRVLSCIALCQSFHGEHEDTESKQSAPNVIGEHVAVSVS